MVQECTQLSCSLAGREVASEQNSDIYFLKHVSIKGVKCSLKVNFAHLMSKGLLLQKVLLLGLAAAGNSGRIAAGDH